jgi:hypothetical protein
MTTTTQPTWKLLQNLGDVNPIDYGGYFVFTDETGVYSPEAELLISPDEEPAEDDPQYMIYRFSLDRFKTIEDEETHTIYLIPYRYNVDEWPYPASRYDEWFHKDLASVARFIGSTVEEMRSDLCSEDPLSRAHAYRAIGDYHGFENFDGYPLRLTRADVETRYADLSL